MGEIDEFGADDDSRLLLLKDLHRCKIINVITGIYFENMYPYKPKRF